MSTSPTSPLYILSGASRGMGLALAEQLLQAGHTVLTLQRSPNPALVALAAERGAELLPWSIDLANAPGAAHELGLWLRAQDPARFTRAVLINNAGVIPPIAPLSASNPDLVAAALRVGLEAPMLLCAAFLNATADWTQPRQILNISSGLGRRAMASQATYCAAKAGMDHFTRCLALEEALKPNGARVCSLAPGVIDTDMQVQLRSAPGELFPDQGNFAALKNEGRLTSPAEAAARLLAYLARPDFGQQPVADVREP